MPGYKNNLPFLKEENMMDTFITPFSTTPRGGSRCGHPSPHKPRRYRNVEPFNHPMSSYFYTKEQKPWFTVIPLGEETPVERENIRVKLNPLNRQLIIKVLTNMAPSRRRTLLSGNKMCKPIVFVVPLPHEIRLEELQVKLTQHNELVILAPFKPTFSHMRLPLDEETLKSSFIRERDMGLELPWKNIPVISYSRIPSRKGKMMSVSAPMRRGGMNVLPFEEDLESSTTEEETTTSEEDTTETESEWTNTDEEEEEPRERGTLKHRFTGFGFGLGAKCGEMKMLVKEYLTLLEKIFYPNVIRAEIVPFPISRGARGLNTRTGLRAPGFHFHLILDVTFVGFPMEDITVRMDTVKGDKVLLVEGKLIHKCPVTGCNVTKYMKRMIPVPHWINVNLLQSHVLSKNTLRLVVPLTLDESFMKMRNVKCTAPATGTATGVLDKDFYYFISDSMKRDSRKKWEDLFGDYYHHHY